MAVSNYPTPVLHALKLLRANPHYLEDARQGSLVGNSIAGSILALTLEVPREYAEHAVREAMSALEPSKDKPNGEQPRRYIDAPHGHVGASGWCTACGTRWLPVQGADGQTTCHECGAPDDQE